MSKQRAFASQERDAQVQRMGHLGRAGLLTLATILSFLTVGLLIADQIYRPDTFVIDQLKIRGKFRHLDPVEIERLIAKRGMGNFFSVELEAIKEEIESMPWVQSAQVRREWPNALLVSVSEHRPVMRWNKNKWVNSVGTVIDLPGKINVPNPIDLSGHKQDSPIMLQQAVRWKKRLTKSGLELKQLELSRSHAWKLILYDTAKGSDFELLLGREDIEDRLVRFQYLYDYQFKKAGQRLHRVDARYPDGLAIKASKINLADAVAVNK